MNCKMYNVFTFHNTTANDFWEISDYPSFSLLKESVSFDVKEYIFAEGISYKGFQALTMSYIDILEAG